MIASCSFRWRGAGARRELHDNADMMTPDSAVAKLKILLEELIPARTLVVAATFAPFCDLTANAQCERASMYWRPAPGPA